MHGQFFAVHSMRYAQRLSRFLPAVHAVCRVPCTFKSFSPNRHIFHFTRQVSLRYYGSVIYFHAFEFLLCFWFLLEMISVCMYWKTLSFPIECCRQIFCVLIDSKSKSKKDRNKESEEPVKEWKRERERESETIFSTTNSNARIHWGHWNRSGDFDIGANHT